MTDQDLLLNEPGHQFGSGIVGVCDVCGKRQAVIVLQRERYKLCVIDFLNKSWVDSKTTPGVPLPAYRSERIWYPTDATANGKAPAVMLTPTRVVKHPIALVTPDVYGLTTQLLDAGIHLARLGCEVMLPDVANQAGIGAAAHVAIHSGAYRGGVSMQHPRTRKLVTLYEDAMSYLKQRAMVDPAKAAIYGASFGGSLAVAYAGQHHGLSAVVLAYPAPVKPFEYLGLLTAPVLVVSGGRDRLARESREQLAKAQMTFNLEVEHFYLPYARHDFLARDLRSYNLELAEMAWTKIEAFLRSRLFPPPPKPPAPPAKMVAAVAPIPNAKLGSSAGAPPSPTRPAGSTGA